MANRLAAETSPYLQQHADNHVDWYPWGEEALTRARELDKPILLSIGYSACHWCHVMAHESFEDQEVAEVMNQHFINIKVDREERPDLDHIYQTAHAMLTQQNGGWPLTLFLTPGQVPYFGGTYFPKIARFNLPGFKELLPRVADFYHTSRDDLEKQNASLLEAFQRTLPVSTETEGFSPAPLDTAFNDLKQSFDSVFGGFSRAPKFPRPTELEFCLQHAAAGGDPVSRGMALFTLAKMANGGIFDQLGGGFCRYSVDERWAIPHFEKMLYDNGPLLSLYTDAFLVSEDANFKRIVEETAGWAMCEMQSPQGGYFSALDADSEHVEGKFYVWTPEQVAHLLSPEEFAVAQAHYGLNQLPNFENKYWHLVIAAELDEVAATLNIPVEQAQQLLTSAKAKLWSARELRVHPGRDEKVLVSWNGLMIKGMARAGRTFGREEWVASAQRAIDFIRSTLWKEDRLLATYKDGKAHLKAYLDDYAFLLDALLELMQAQFRPEDLAFARSLANVLLQQFEDKANGGFFFTSHDHEKLIHRPKPGHDNAIPSGNGVAAYALQRLGHLLGESAYIEASERTLKLYYPTMETQPVGYMSLLMALREYLSPMQIMVLRGPANDLAEWQKLLAKVYSPHSMLLYLPNTTSGLPESLSKPVSDHVNAWVCQGVKCLPAISRREELIQVFKSVSVS